MSKESRKLESAYKNLIADIFDNYDKYSSDEISQIKNELAHLNALNNLLERYDKKKKNWWDVISEWFGNATGK